MQDPAGGIIKRPIILGAAVAAAAVAGWTAFAPDATPPGPAPQGAALAAVTIPDTLSPQAQIGRTAFEANCAACHGQNAAGVDGAGPPLVHKIYEPSHHGDESFQLAVAQGVRAHHWRFGNMQAVEGLTRADVSAIIAYVRELQRANGID